MMSIGREDCGARKNMTIPTNAVLQAAITIFRDHNKSRSPAKKRIREGPEGQRIS